MASTLVQTQIGNSKHGQGTQRFIGKIVNHHPK